MTPTNAFSWSAVPFVVLALLSLPTTRNCAAFVPPDSHRGSRSSSSSDSRIVLGAADFLTHAEYRRIELMDDGSEELLSEAANVDRLHRIRMEREGQNLDWSFPHALWTVNFILAAGLFLGASVTGGTPVVVEESAPMGQQQQLLQQRRAGKMRQQQEEDYSAQMYMLDQSQEFFFF